MAEFLEVLRRAKSMCMAFGTNCEGCELHERSNLCPLIVHDDDYVPMNWELKDMPEIERIVMDWAEKNPEPRYPTWTEWLCEYYRHGGDLRKPIPADIAKKLGIKPIEGVSE